MRKSLTRLASVAVTVASVLAASPALAATKMILSNDSQALSFKGKTFEHLESTIEADATLAAALTVEVHHGGALYSQKTQIQGVQLGGAHLISPTPGIYTNTWPQLNVLLLPYLLPGPAAIQAAMNDPLVGQEMLADLEARGLKTVAIWMNGPRNIGAARPLLTPADLRGVKVRVQPAAVFVEAMKAFGANPSTMSWGEVPAALQQGVIDAVEPTPNAWLSSKLFEVANHITDMRYVYSFYLVSTNKAWWEGLPTEVRTALQSAIDATTRWNWAEAERVNEEANRAMQDMGVTIHNLTPEQNAAWVEAARPVWKSLGEPLVGAEVMQRLQEIGAAHR